MSNIVVMFARCRRRWLNALALMFGLCASGPAWALIDVTLQLRWAHQFQFAGYYAALQQGYYRDAGFSVTIVPGGPGRIPVHEVSAGRADFGVANSELLLHYLKGEPLLALAAIGQTSPSVLLTRKDHGIRSPQDFTGKRIMMVGGSEDIEFLAMLLREGVAIDSLDIVPTSYRLEDLIEGRVDVFNAYLSNEPFQMQEQGVEPFVIKPIDYGIDFYSDILFTRAPYFKQHPERVKQFLAASIRGWRYALSHPDAMIDLLLTDYQVPRSRAHLEYEARVFTQLVHADSVPIGNINPGRFQRMTDWLIQFGFIPKRRYALDNLVFQPVAKIEQALFWQTLAIVCTVLLGIAGIAAWLWHNRQQLQREIDLRRQSEQQLRASERHFRDIIENLQDVYYRVDNAGCIVALSPSAAQLFGQPIAALLGRNAADFYEPPLTRSQFLQELNSHGGQLSGYELRLRTAQNRRLWVAVNCHSVFEDGCRCGVEGMLHDITELKESQEKLRFLAFEDALTGLLNRRALLDMLNQAMSAGLRHQQQGALLFIDLNDFKPVNDQYGHGAGDKLLQYVAERLQEVVRMEDTVFRLGGDEFVVLMPRIDLTDAARLRFVEEMSQRIQKTLARPFVIEQITITISASLGMTLFPQPGQDADAIIDAADEAMYAAKHTYKQSHRA
ncbi:MAG: ABC transporter substrate-binding protein [Methylococcales bacterium]|nr:ABC transporter substrate-binding protein [Methylococcales bacterium]